MSKLGEWHERAKRQAAAAGGKPPEPRLLPAAYPELREDLAEQAALLADETCMSKEAGAIVLAGALCLVAGQGGTTEIHHRGRQHSVTAEAAAMLLLDALQGATDKILARKAQPPPKSETAAARAKRRWSRRR